MSRITVIDNTLNQKLPLQKFHHDCENLRKIANKTISDLQTESGILIYPPRVSETKERMKRINDVIEKTEGLNDSYKIGGAYFLNATDFDKLWRIKLSPLIKEYLRGIDDDGSKFDKIQDAYFGNIDNDSYEEDEDVNTPTVD